MAIDEIQKIEDTQIPKGRIDLVGIGRLGLRIGINLIQVHRGGPKVIGAFDGQKISASDIIFNMYGAKIGEYKTDFLKRLCRHDEDFRKIKSYNEYANNDNIDLINGDVVIIVIAGGNTIPTATKIMPSNSLHGTNIRSGTSLPRKQNTVEYEITSFPYKITNGTRKLTALPLPAILPW